MQVQRIDNLFNFTYEKTAAEVKQHAETKRDQVKLKIRERQARVAKLREEHGITDAVLIDIQNQMRAAAQNAMHQAMYSSTVKSDDGGDVTVSVGAGAVNNLLTEMDYINGERAQVERLELIIRNIRDVERRTANGMTYVELFRLNSDELKFLGF